MTETEAYQQLGWPRAGGYGFVLPISGSDRTDWETYECPTGCGYRGLCVLEARRDPMFMDKCPRCNVPWIWS
jgi:hypothetical protein